MNPSRRRFLLKSAQTGAWMLVGGVVWGALLHESRVAASSLRPPGARPEPDYLGTCIKCGMCVEACPYDTLSLGRSGDRSALGVPGFEPRRTPCYMCPDVPCARACPSGALEKNVRIEEARMGLAVLLDQETCLAYQGLRCEVCYRVCPLIGKAISLHFRRGDHGGPHAFFEPRVNSEACTGCGMCEHACVLGESAIKVLPRATAKGPPGTSLRIRERARTGVNPRPDASQERAEDKTTPWEEGSLGEALKTLEGERRLYD